VSVHRTAGDAGTATITVSDSGSGFKPGAEDKRRGIGLVRRLVEQVRGSLRVESSHGTVWTVKFPIAVARPARG
jgi:two-component sensor histidine kinase